MPDERPARRPAGPTRIEVLLETSPPHPWKSILVTGWPAMVIIVVLAVVAGFFFPVLAGLVMIGAPLAVIAAFAVTTIRAHSIRLTVTDEVVRVSSGKSGVTCDRYGIDRLVLVDGLKRRWSTPRSPALIMLDSSGHAIMLLSALLWSAPILERVIDLLAPVPLDRTGPQTSKSLSALYPNIFRSR